MSGQPLLHPSLNPHVTRGLIAVGIIMVLVGAADAASRLSTWAAGSQAGLVAFAPAAALDNNPNAALTALNNLGTSTTVIVPARLRIPSIGVVADVEQVGKKADGSMGTPQKFGDVAWYAPGQKPGEPGNAVIDGHVNNALTTAGVFQHLNQVALGDQVLVTDASGKTLTFIVTDVEDVAADAPTPASIFNATGPSQLVLITCDGEWITDEHQFNERLIVVARLV